MKKEIRGYINKYDLSGNKLNLYIVSNGSRISAKSNKCITQKELVEIKSVIDFLKEESTIISLFGFWDESDSLFLFDRLK